MLWMRQRFEEHPDSRHADRRRLPLRPHEGFGLRRDLLLHQQGRQAMDRPERRQDDRTPLQRPPRHHQGPRRALSHDRRDALAAQVARTVGFDGPDDVADGRHDSRRSDLRHAGIPSRRLVQRPETLLRRGFGQIPDHVARLAQRSGGGFGRVVGRDAHVLHDDHRFQNLQ